MKGGRLGRLAAALALAALLGAGAAAHADAPTDLFPAAAPTSANALPAQKAVATPWSSHITFVNRAGSTRTVRVESFASGPEGNVGVTITRTVDGKSAALGKDGTISLEAGTNLDLVASANLAKPGAYTVFVRLLDDKRAELTNASLTVTREPDTMPDDGVVSSPTQTRFFSGVSEVAMTLPVRGLADRALGFTITGATVIRVGKSGESDAGLALTGAPPGAGQASSGATPADGASETPLSPSAATMRCIGGRIEQTGPYTVDPGGSCTLALALSNVPAGDYRLRFNLAGTGGGARAVEMPFKVRACVWWLVLWLVIGAIGGAIVTWWRDIQQPRVREALVLAQLDEEIRQKASETGLPNATDLLGRLTYFVAELRIRVADGESLEDLKTERDEIRARLKLVGDAIYHWVNATEANRQANAALYEATLRTVASGSPAAATAAVDKLRDKLYPDLAALGGAAPEAGGTVPLPEIPGLFSRAGLRVLQNVMLTFELLTSLILFAFFVLLVVLVVWDADPAWGSTADMILAVLIGAGAFGSMATTLGTFRTNISTVRGQA